MKKYAPLILILVVVTVGVLIYRGSSLQTQVLKEPTQSQSLESAKTIDDCKKLSQTLANRCFQKLAVENKDLSFCNQITRPLDKQRCQREVRLK